MAGVRGGVQAVRAAFSPQALCFRVEGQLLSQVTLSLVNMEEVGERLLNGTLGYFGGTERQVAVEEEGALTSLDSPTMTWD